MDHKDICLSYRLAFDEKLYFRRESFSSVKAGIVHCDNGLEYFLCRRLDVDPQVISFKVHHTRFQYFCPEDEVVQEATFSFSVTMRGGQERLLYVTSQNLIDTSIEEARLEAAECRAHDLGASYELWTEPEVFGPNPSYMKSVIRYVMDRLYLKEEINEPVATPHCVPDVPYRQKTRSSTRRMLSGTQ